jgi:tetratricopeptide (TPR) repeat protein
VLLKQGKYREAEKNYKSALELDKNYNDAKTNYGALLLELGQIEEAVKQYDEVLQNDPSNSTAHFNKAVALLLSGKLEEGWKEYDWRFYKGNVEKPEFAKPEWKGEDLTGKTILVHDEQGVGDSIQFVRFLKLLKEKNTNVVFKCRKVLINLYKNLDFVDELVDLTETYNAEYDYEISLLSLPHVLKIDLNNIPLSDSYLNIDAELTENWKNKLSGIEKLKVGLVWKGNPNHEFDFKRSVSLREFKNILKNDNIVFYSLQKENSQTELKNTGIIDLSTDFSNLEDTAAAIAEIDLVITVDTAAAHLAGALGKEAWVLLPNIPDWRWLLNRDDSPWYSSIKLFRQEEPGKWENVFADIKNELNKKLSENDDELLKEF